MQSIAQLVINDIDRLEDIDVDIEASQEMGYSNDEQDQSHSSIAPLKNIRSHFNLSTPILDRSAIRYATNIGSTNIYGKFFLFGIFKSWPMHV